MSDDQKTQCLICTSSAVIDRRTARALVLAITALQGFVLSLQRSQSLEAALDSAQLALEQPTTELLAFIADVDRYQFAGFDCLCLRCGARFDAVNASTLQPGGQ